MVCTGAVLREADLYKTWMPFVTRSDILKWKGQASLLGHFEISVPLMFRDAVIHAYACDTLTQVSRVSGWSTRSTPTTSSALDHPGPLRPP